MASIRHPPDTWKPRNCVTQPELGLRDRDERSGVDIGVNDVAPHDGWTKWRTRSLWAVHLGIHCDSRPVPRYWRREQ
jgi:hypothetical protein